MPCTLYNEWHNQLGGSKVGKDQETCKKTHLMVVVQLGAATFPHGRIHAPRHRLSTRCICYRCSGFHVLDTPRDVHNSESEQLAVFMAMLKLIAQL